MFWIINLQKGSPESFWFDRFVSKKIISMHIVIKLRLIDSNHDEVPSAVGYGFISRFWVYEIGLRFIAVEALVMDMWPIFGHVQNKYVQFLSVACKCEFIIKHHL